MAGTLIRYFTGSTLYAVVILGAQIRNTSTGLFENPQDANWTDYDHALSEFGTTGLFSLTYPALAVGQYRILVYVRAGANPDPSDMMIWEGAMTWDGSAEVSINAVGLKDDALTSASLAASAVAEIQSGLSTFDPTSDEVDVGEVKGVAVVGVDDFKADVSGLATAANLTIVDTVVDAIKLVTDNLPDAGALTTLTAYVDELETRLTAARAGYLDELAAANIPADIDTLIARLTAARAGYLDELAAANIPADIDALLARLTATRAAYLDYLTRLDQAISTTESNIRGTDSDDLKDLSDQIDGIAGTGSTPATSALGITISQNDVELTGRLQNFYPGEAFSFTVLCKVDDIAQNITGDTLTITVKSAKSDLDTAALIQKTADVTTYGASGYGVFSFAHTDTEDLDPGDVYVDIFWERAAGSKRIAYDNPVKILTRVSDP